MSRATRPPERPTDMRALRRRHDRRGLLATVLILVVGGSVLVALFYGPGSVLTAFPFLLLGAAGIAVLYGLFALLERWATKEDE